MTDMGGQAHVVLKMFKVVTHKLCDDLILLCHLLLDITKLLGLHDHHVVHTVHHVVGLEERPNQSMPITDPQFDLTTDWTSAIE